MDAARRLALRLHSMHEADRSWLLQQIEAEPRQKLMALLDEIRALGLVPDASMLAFASDACGNGSSQPEAGLHIGMTAAAKVFHALRNEPAFVRRYLSQAQQWPWRNELDQEQALFLQCVPEEMAQHPQCRLAPSAHRALLQAFAEQISETDIPAVQLAPPARHSFLKRFRRPSEWRR